MTAPAAATGGPGRLDPARPAAPGGGRPKRRPPRVLIVSSYYPPMKAPEAAHTLFLAERLAASGVDVHVLTSAEVGRPAPAGYTVHPVMPRWGWRSAPALLRAVRRVRPDAVLLIYLSWLYWHHPLLSLLPVVGRLAAPGARFVTQFEYVQTEPLRWPAAVRWAFGRLRWPGRTAAAFGPLLVASDRLIFLCDQHREVARPHAAAAVGRAAVIPAPPIMTILPPAGGEARARGRRLVGAAAGEFVVVYFGFIYRAKGVDTLLRAAAAAAPKVGRFRLVLVGGTLHDGYGDEMRRLATDLGLDPVVTWAGHCPPEDETASLYLHAADLCALPFNAGVRLHNSSFAVAASHRLPVLTTAGPDLEPQFAHGENVWLCPPGDPAAMAAGLDRLAADPALRDRLRAGAGRLADEWFSWDRVVAETRRVLFD